MHGRTPLAAVLLAAAAMAVPASAGSGATNQATCADAQGHPVGGVLSWTPTTLWPPNGQLVPVNISWADDHRDGITTSLTVTSVSEQDGDGQPQDATGGDAQPGSSQTGDDRHAATYAEALRATRPGRSTGRTYTLDVRCTEQTDMHYAVSHWTAWWSQRTLTRTGTAVITVTVPHDQHRR